MLMIDGGMGEGGGQILRTSLALSLVTGKELTLKDIRCRRKKPGLRAQHLNAVKLSAEIGDAQVEGVEFGSTKLVFSPQSIRGGKYSSDIGTAGATSLVLQSVFLPLSLANKPSQILISGGTHVPFAPTFDFLNLHWKNFLNRIGIQISITLQNAGFYPRGGGQMSAHVQPVQEVSNLRLTDRGSLKQICGISAVANLDRNIAERQRNTILRILGHKYPLNDIRIVELPSSFKGTTICLVCEFEHSQCSYTSLGEPGKPAKVVAQEVCRKVENFLSTDSAIDEYLADQLLLPLSISREPSQFSTAKITDHLQTNADVIKLFTNADIDIVGNTGSPGAISIYPKLE